MQIGGVVFDLDHTLFDRFETFKLCAPVLYKQFSHTFKKDYDLEKFTEFIIETDKHYNHKGWDAIGRHYVENLIEDTNAFSWNEYRKVLMDDCFMRFAVKYEFAEPMLKTLRKTGLKIGLITNGPGKRQRAKLENLNIEKYFDSIIISGEFGAEKPDVAPFYKMSENLGIRPERLLYVGDHPINDATASQNAGYIPVLVKTMGFFTLPCAESFEHCINNVGELVDYINTNFS